LAAKTRSDPLAGTDPNFKDKSRRLSPAGIYPKAPNNPSANKKLGGITGDKTVLGNGI